MNNNNRQKIESYYHAVFGKELPFCFSCIPRDFRSSNPVKIEKEEKLEKFTPKLANSGTREYQNTLDNLRIADGRDFAATY